MNNKQRQTWGTKLGIVLAVAGSAVGIGNFLRFPVQAASNGGGAFMIPYFISFLLLGIPLMWIEWTLGRFGGGFGHGTAPGIFHSINNKARFIKYFGVVGIFGPIVIFIYYTYIESWTLAYSFFAMTGKLFEEGSREGLQNFLSSYQGLNPEGPFSSKLPAYAFFLVTFAANVSVISLGIRGGIEKLCRIAMPLLLVCGTVLMIRVLTLGTPDPAKPDWNLVNGLGFLWNPDMSALKSAKVWLAASGQIFFTLSVGIGMILTYASYLKRGDDVALSGLTAAGTNEFTEVILGGSIIIPAAFVFLGPAEIREVAQAGAFNLGFVTMPFIFEQIVMGPLFCCIWFLLLFIAGVTSSISIAQPAVAFLEDEFDMSRKRAVMIFAAVCFILCQPAIFFLGNGVVDELDFWGGTFCLVLFGTIETILFGWVFGMDKAWEEIHHGAQMRIPKAYKFIIKYITPAFLLCILGSWLWQTGIDTMLMKNVPAANRPYILATRAGLLALFITLAVLVKISWNRRKREAAAADAGQELRT